MSRGLPDCNPLRPPFNLSPCHCQALGPQYLSSHLNNRRLGLILRLKQVMRLGQQQHAAHQIGCRNPFRPPYNSEGVWRVPGNWSTECQGPGAQPQNTGCTQIRQDLNRAPAEAGGRLIINYWFTANRIGEVSTATAPRNWDPRPSQSQKKTAVPCTHLSSLISFHYPHSLILNSLHFLAHKAAYGPCTLCSSIWDESLLPSTRHLKEREKLNFENFSADSKQPKQQQFWGCWGAMARAK